MIRDWKVTIVYTSNSRGEVRLWNQTAEQAEELCNNYRNPRVRAVYLTYKVEA